MIKAKRRFEFGGHVFRITKQFSYEMAYEAFCQGYVDPEELIGKTVTIIGEYGYEQEFRIVEVAPKIMAVPGKHLQVFDNKKWIRKENICHNDRCRAGAPMVVLLAKKLARLRWLRDVES